MSVRFEKSGNTLTVLLSGEIDHHSAVSMRECIDSAVKTISPDTLVLDFGAVSFMDSSGVGLVMGRYKLIDYMGGTLRIRNASQRIEKILKLSGIEKIAVMDDTGRKDVAV